MPVLPLSIKSTYFGKTSIEGKKNLLPEIDGLEVCKILRRDPSTSGIPIIMLTAKAAEIDRILGLELGADDYVTKPFSLEEVLARLRGLVRRANLAAVDRPPRMAEEEGVQVDVLEPRELVVEAGAQLEDGGEAPAHRGPPLARLEDL